MVGLRQGPLRGQQVGQQEPATAQQRVEPAVEQRVEPAAATGEGVLRSAATLQAVAKRGPLRGPQGGQEAAMPALRGPQGG